MKPRVRSEARSAPTDHLGRAPRRRPGPGGADEAALWQLRGRTDERAEIVRWLRVWAPRECTAGGKALAKLHGQLADAIERGAHVPAEKP